MTRVIMLGAETGHEHAEGAAIITTGPTFDTSVKRSGTRSFKFDTSTVCALSYGFVGALARRMWVSGWFYVPTATGYPGSAATIIRFLDTGGVALCSARMSATGTLTLLDAAGAAVGSASAVAALDTWHKVDLAVEVGTGTVDYAEMWLNNTSVASASSVALGEAAPASFRFGWVTDPGTSEVIYFDDIILNDAQGSVHNTRSGDDKVVLLLPTADSARDTNWILGAGGTTSVFEAVNNTPPIGVDTATATDTSQVENAASTTTEEYDATMTTYTAAGIAAPDTITALYTLIEGGNSSTTGTDLVGVTVESNPTLAETTHSIDIITVTYPTGWNRGRGTVTENPSVTKGTAPVLSIRKNIAATRISQVCFMGIYVSYIVGVAGTAVRHNSIMMVG